MSALAAYHAGLKLELCCSSSKPLVSSGRAFIGSESIRPTDTWCFWCDAVDEEERYALQAAGMQLDRCSDAEHVGIEMAIVQLTRAVEAYHAGQTALPDGDHTNED